MRIKRLFGGVAVAGVVGLSTLGLAEGVANASTTPSSSDTAAVQPVDWHGGYGYGYGHDGGRGYGHWGGWPGFGWHPWGWHRW
jgi:hypothetical protein